MDPIITFPNEIRAQLESSTQKKRLVVLGGGFGGLNLIRRLQIKDDLKDKLEMVLIDQKDYFENVIAAARSVVIPEFHSQMVRKYTDYMEYASFIKGTVLLVSHSPREITVVGDNKKEFVVPYDYLVVSLGTTYPIFKPEESILESRTTEVKKITKQIEEAKHILIVGGRGVGVEVAAEIIYHYPLKKVTIVHSRDNLMDIWPHVGIELVNQYMSQTGVNVILNNRVVSSNGTQHTLSDGRVIEADLKILSLGGKPNSQAFVKYFSSSISADGYIKINLNQQLLGHENIFVIGDICDITQNKNAVMIKQQVPTVEENIEAMVNSNPLVPINLQGISFAFPYHLALGTEYGIGINPFTDAVQGSKEEGDHMTHQYHNIVKMTTESWRIEQHTYPESKSVHNCK